MWETLIDVFSTFGEWIGGIINAIFLKPVQGGGGGGVSKFPTWEGDVFSDAQLDVINGAWTDLLPFIAIPVAIAVIFFSIKLIKKISWGY